MSAAPLGVRLFAARRWLAAVLLVLGVVGYPAGFQADPYVFGIMLLALGPLQIGTALVGILARVAWGDRHNTALAWLVDWLLLGTAVAGYAFARTISWT
jgi:hypothetical protein